VPLLEYRRFVRDVLGAAGADAGDATAVAEGLLWADLQGRPGQGMQRLPNLARRLARGLIRSPAAMAWSEAGTAARVLDAADGFGHVAGTAAMREAVALASSHGVGLVLVRRSVHFGAASYYCAQATEAGCLALACTNAYRKVAAHGGRTPVLGTNPLAFGCPTGTGEPLLVDVSTSSLAGSGLRGRQGSGRLPPGSALDADGRPTDDPAAAEAGCLLPAAGPKGYGLALMVEVLSAVLSGAAVGGDVGSVFHTWDRPVDAGHAFLAASIPRFMPIQAFIARMDSLVGWVKASPPLDPANPVRFPGEGRGRLAELQRREGIRLAEAARRAADAAAADWSVAPFRG
jgi:LDH2 family malate/lactate/ureidoglycolate dehydrogenase